MKIELSPKVAKLVKDLVNDSNLTMRVHVRGSKTSATEIVNELVWMALRKGDIRKGWK